MLDPCLLWMPTPLLLLLVPTARQFKRNERATNSNGRKDKEFHFLRVFRVQFATPHQQQCRRRQRRHRGEKKTTESSLDVCVCVCDFEGWTFRFFFIISVREAHFSIYLFFYLQNFWLTIFSQPTLHGVGNAAHSLHSKYKKRSTRTISLLSNHNFCFRFE